MSQNFEFFDFQRRFSTELRCIKFLFKQRWPNGFICPGCHHNQYSFHSTRKLYQCKRCKYQASLTARTIFHRTRTPLKKWFWMIFLITRSKTGCSILYLQKMLQINLYKTAWTMVRKINEAMHRRDAIYRLGTLLEMDDAYFGERNVSGKPGRGADKKSSVIIAVGTRESNHGTKPSYVKMQVTEDIKKESVEDFVYKNIQPKSKIKTDAYKSYHWLKDSEYEHEVVKILYPKDALEKLPWVHILIGNIKGILKGVHHGVSSKYLKHYVFEFCYKFNRRFIEKSMFSNLLKTCINTQTITLAELRA